MKRKAIYRFFDRYLGIPIVFFLRIFIRKKKRIPFEIKRVLIIKFAAIGDAILMVPVLRILKNTRPDVKIYFLSSHINYFIVNKNKYIDKIININVYKFLINPFAFARFIMMMRRREFDVIFDAEQWSRISVIIASFSKSKYTIGFKMEKQYKHYLYSSYVDHSRYKHEVENFLSLLQPLGIHPGDDDKKPEFFLTEEEEEFASKFMEDNNLNNKFVICFQPSTGTSGYAREWKDENYAELGRRIVDKFKNVRILLTGAKEDFGRCEKIMNNIGKSTLNIAGKNTIGKDVAIVKRSNLMICGNTGILHMSASVGTQTIGLHGPNNPLTWGAYDENAVSILSDIYCSPCLYIGHDFGCRKPTCMERIKVDDVYLKIVEIISK
ncbi:MAG: glycosyltransferase family 9 protein [Ignavibacteria bacterium]|nr:glycosyltransferase family 9 protein [Ignavibacteria bacterium]